MSLSAIWSREPVAVVNAVRLVMLAAMTFGLHLTNIQLGASMLALESVLTIFTRAQVASPSTLEAMTPATLAAAQSAPDPVKETVRKLP